MVTSTENRQRFLLELGDCIRAVSDAREVKRLAAEMVGQHLGVARAGYAEIIDDGEVIYVESDWSDGVTSLQGKARLLEGFGAEIASELRAGITVNVIDYRTDKRTQGAGVSTTWESIQLCSVVAVPLVKNGRFVAFFYLHEPTPRSWSQAELLLAQDVAERTWDAFERARAENALRVSEERLRGITDAMPALISYFDRDQRFRFVNRAYCEWFGRSLDEIQGRLLPEVMGEDMYEARRPYVERAIEGEILSYEVEFSRGSRHRITRVQHVPHVSEDGWVLGVYSMVQDITQLKQIEEELRKSRDALREEARYLETLNRVGAAVSAELDLERLVQMVTDAGVEVTGAEFGAFFYNVIDEQGESFTLYTLSGADRSAFEHFGLPRATAVFQPTFRGHGVVRSDDIQADPRYGLTDPHRGMPRGHLPVRSYLAIPVMLRNGEVAGGLFFGHSDAARFHERHEQLMLGIAAQAAIAIDNARLYSKAQTEIAERKRAEEHQRLLINELNHRVKNSLAIVQGLAQQTFRNEMSMPEAREAFEGRLAALSDAHGVLTRENWEQAQLAAIIIGVLTAFHSVDGGRLHLTGVDIPLQPKTAVSIAMAFHELATNSVKYGAWSNDEGQVTVNWEIKGPKGQPRLQLVWQEQGGPFVRAPARKGFGSRMIERALAAELNGTVRLDYKSEGLRCMIDAPLPSGTRSEELQMHGAAG